MSNLLPKPMTNLTIKGIEVGPGWFTVYGNGDHTLEPNMWGTRAMGALSFRMLYSYIYPHLTAAVREIQPPLLPYSNLHATPLENFELFHPKGHKLPAPDHFHILMYDTDITTFQIMMLKEAFRSVDHWGDIEFTDFYDNCDPELVPVIKSTRQKLWEEAISHAKKG